MAAAPPPMQHADAARPCSEVTGRILLEIIEHEAIVLEAYKDSVGVWTWGVGVTDASGHKVYPRYRRKPATLERALEVFEWLLRTKYLPEVERAFLARELSETQLGAALSFHWNTGAILRAKWVGSWLLGREDLAREEFMAWSRPREIIARRKAEMALFFDGRWTSDGRVTIFDEVSREARANQVWESARLIDIRPALGKVLAARGGGNG